MINREHARLPDSYSYPDKESSGLLMVQESRRALQASNLLSNGDLKVKSEH